AALRPNIRQALQGFAQLIDALRAGSQDATPAAVMEDVVQRIDYESLLAAEGVEGNERWGNVRELIVAASAWSGVITEDDEASTLLQRFLAEAALLSAVDTSEGKTEGVTLMTLLTAKGLEWPVVVIAGMEEGLFPSARALESPTGLEEE